MYTSVYSLTNIWIGTGKQPPLPAYLNFRRMNMIYLAHGRDSFPVGRDSSRWWAAVILLTSHDRWKINARSSTVYKTYLQTYLVRVLYNIGCCMQSIDDDVYLVVCKTYVLRSIVFGVLLRTSTYSSAIRVLEQQYTRSTFYFSKYFV